MFTLLMSVAFAGALPGAPRPESCETSARWSRLDESTLDLDAPAGTAPVVLTTGCRFVGIPGSAIDVAVGASHLSDLPVLGIRRGQGQVIVAATPSQAALLRGGGLRVERVGGGDWLRLVEVSERLRFSQPPPGE